MFLLNIFFASGISLIFLAIIFIPMEKAFPANPKQKIFRKGWMLDFCFFLGQYFIWSSLVLITLQYFNDWLNSLVSLKFQTFIKKQPFWLQTFEVLLLSDFLIYWAHRLQHKYDFLWRFHKVHHSAKQLDWLAAYREHPIDSIYTIGIINLPAIILGFNLNAISTIVAFRGIWAIYIHSNIRFSIGFLKLFIGAPELHHWHHDIERDRGNYANISPLMDIAFGTYYCPNKEPEKFGIKEAFPQNYFAQILFPLLPQKILMKLKKRKN